MYIDVQLLTSKDQTFCAVKIYRLRVTVVVARRVCLCEKEKV